MALSVLQTPTAVLTDAGGATSAISFASPVTVGSGIVFVYADAGAANPIGVPTVADNQSHGAYTNAVSATEASAGQRVAIFYLPVVVNSSGTFTVTSTHAAGSNNYSLIGAIEVGTGGGGITKEQSNSGTVLTTSPVTANVTTVVADQVEVGAMTLDSSTSDNGIGAGFSGGTRIMYEPNSSAHVSAAGDYKVISAAGSQTVSYSITASHIDAVAIIATFKEVAGGGGGRTTKNTRSWNLGGNVGMGWRM